jgi:hypothetical protein
LEDKKKIYNMVQQASAVYTRDPKSSGTSGVIKKRNELVDKYFEKREEMEKSTTQRE